MLSAVVSSSASCVTASALLPTPRVTATLVSGVLKTVFWLPKMLH